MLKWDNGQPFAGLLFQLTLHILKFRWRYSNLLVRAYTMAKSIALTDVHHHRWNLNVELK